MNDPQIRRPEVIPQFDNTPEGVMLEAESDQISQQARDGVDVLVAAFRYDINAIEGGIPLSAAVLAVPLVEFYDSWSLGVLLGEALTRLALLPDLKEDELPPVD